MQAAVQDQHRQNLTQENTGPRLAVSLELLAYAALVLLAALLRLAELDSVAITTPEAPRALAAHQLAFNGAITGSLPDSPLLLWLQALSFNLLGSSEFAARILTAVGGLLLTLTPLLFRSRFGVVWAFITSLLLAFSPAVLVTSRLGDAAIWTVLFAVLALWALWRFWDHGRYADALWAAVFAVLMALLSGPGGPLLLIVLLLTSGLALWLTMLAAPVELDLTAGDVLALIRERLGAFPVRDVPLVGGGLLLALSSGFMLHPPAVGTVAELLETFFAGLTRPLPGAPLAHPLLTLVYYEVWLLALAFIGLVLLVRAGRFTFAQRFLAGWALLGMLAGLLYAGGQPGHALWVVLPLAALAAFAIELLLADHAIPFFAGDLFSRDFDDIFMVRIWWAKWVVGLGALAVLLMFSVHLQEVARSLLSLPTVTEWEILLEPRFMQFRYSLIWLFITLVILVSGFFLAAGFWGNTNTLQGLGLGLVAFSLLAGLTGGWNAAVTEAGSPAQPWHIRATPAEVHLLRDTLYDIARRDTLGFPDIEVLVLRDDGLLAEDGVAAWLLRDFHNSRWVNRLEEAARQQIVLLPDTLSEPELGGSYVGQRFVIERTWDIRTMRLIDLPGWWLQRKTHLLPIESGVVLWLRMDVYSGLSPALRP